MSSKSLDLSSYSYFLFDYADVLSLAQDEASVRRMARLLDLSFEKFKEFYWQHRKAYDLGCSGSDYWSNVAGRPLSAALIEQLISADIEGWGRINLQTVRYVERLRAEDKKLGVLSNLPRDLARAIYGANPFFSLFDHVFFSADIALVKPDPRIYSYTLQKIQVNPQQVIFFDDRNENLVAAQASGMGTYLFEANSAARLLGEEDAGRGLDTGAENPGPNNLG